MKKSSSSPSSRATGRTKAFTLAELITAIGEAISTSDDPGIRKLRAPSIPTLKNISRKGMFAGKSMALATQMVLAHMQERSVYYAEKEANSTSSRPQTSPSTMSNPVNEQILVELQGMNKRINDIEKSISMGMSAKNAEIHPLVLSTVNHLNDTRKFIMARLDNELQGGGRAGAPSRQFDSATAMDAQRILAGVSQIKDLLAGIVPPR